MNSQGQTKASVMQAIMKNKVTSKSFREALRSPIGSTARQRAQKIFNIMNKLQESHDGVGGPGMAPGARSEQTSAVNPLPPMEPRNMVILNKLPNMDITYGKKKNNGLGGPGIFSNYTIPAAPTFVNPLPPLGERAPAPKIETPFPGIWSGIKSAVKSGWDYAPPEGQVQDTQTMPGKMFGDFKTMKIGGFDVPTFPTPTPGDPTTPAPAPQSQDLSNLLLTPEDKQAMIQAQQAKVATAPPATTQPVVDTTPSPTGAPPATLPPSTPLPAAPPPAGAPPTIESYPGVQAAVDANKGASAFALETMLKDKESPYYTGTTLGQAYVDAEKDLWDKYNIEELRDQSDLMKKIGATLPTDIQTFIIERDENLNETENRINTYLKDLESQDMSDPLKRRDANRYLNYLYTLRGAQNRRYVDFMKDSLDRFDARTVETNTNLKNALDDFQMALNRSDLITKDTYDSYSKALADMYTSVEGAPLREKQLAAMDADILRTYAQIASENAKASEQGSYVDALDDLKNADIYDNKGFIMPELDIASVLTNLRGSGVSLDNILRVVVAKTGNLLNASNEAATEYGDTVDMEFKEQTAESILSQLESLSDLSLADGDIASAGTYRNYATDVARLMGRLAGREMSKETNETVMEGAIKTVETLSKKGWFGFGEIPSKEEFLEKFSEETGTVVPSEVGEAIYTALEKYEGTPDSFVKDFLYVNGTPMSPEQIAWKLADMYFYRKAPWVGVTNEDNESTQEEQPSMTMSQ